MMETPVLGVIGGSGLYQMSGLENSETVDIDTPFGKPSAPVVIGEIAGKRVAFLARHGIGHHISPSEVNYRQHLPRKLGIRSCQHQRADRCVKITSGPCRSRPDFRFYARAKPLLLWRWTGRSRWDSRPNLQRACQTSAGGSSRGWGNNP